MDPSIRSLRIAFTSILVLTALLELDTVEAKGNGEGGDFYKVLKNQENGNCVYKIQYNNAAASPGTVQTISIDVPKDKAEAGKKEITSYVAAFINSHHPDIQLTNSPPNKLLKLVQKQTQTQGGDVHNLTTPNVRPYELTTMTVGSHQYPIYTVLVDSPTSPNGKKEYSFTVPKEYTTPDKLIKFAAGYFVNQQTGEKLVDAPKAFMGEYNKLRNSSNTVQNNGTSDLYKVKMDPGTEKMKYKAEYNCKDCPNNIGLIEVEVPIEKVQTNQVLSFVAEYIHSKYGDAELLKTPPYELLQQLAYLTPAKEISKEEKKRLKKERKEQERKERDNKDGNKEEGEKKSKDNSGKESKKGKKNKDELGQRLYKYEGGQINGFPAKVYRVRCRSDPHTKEEKTITIQIPDEHSAEENLIRYVADYLNKNYSNIDLINSPPPELTKAISDARKKTGGEETGSHRGNHNQSVGLNTSQSTSLQGPVLPASVTPSVSNHQTLALTGSSPPSRPT